MSRPSEDPGHRDCIPEPIREDAVLLRWWVREKDQRAQARAIFWVWIVPGFTGAALLILASLVFGFEL